ncbi:MAG: biopolymer transporter ExbD [Leeuwenhoekiella sp.]
MRNSRESVNAGSMADIAFLLLIFFLVTTTITDEKGLSQSLPEKCQTEDCSTKILERNTLRITLNAHNNVLVNDELIDVSKLKLKVIAFVENPLDDKQLSQNPQKAVIAINASRETEYREYVQVLNIIETVYWEIRNKQALKDYNSSYDALDERQRKKILALYPLQLAETKN